MRRKTVNKNVLKAMTIGIAAVIATTSIPMDVYASTEGGQGGDPNEQNNQQPESQEQQIDTAIELIEGVPANEETGEAAVPGALDLIADADAKADAYVETLGLEGTDEAKALDQELANAANYLADAERTGVKLGEDGEFKFDENGNVKLDENGKATNGAEKDLKDAKVLVATGFEQVDKAYEEMKDAKGADQVAATTGEINEDSDNNGKSDLVDEVQGYANSANAASDYNTAAMNKGLAQEAYSNAATALEQAQIKYNAAVEAKKAADSAFNAANEKIEHAQVNSAAAYQELQDAQNNLEALKQQASAKQEELEAIQKQYYALQVQYYRLAGINGNTTIKTENENGEKVEVKVFGEDGKLNTDYAAQWIVENNKVQTAAEKNDENQFIIGRYLMRELIEAKLKEEGATDIVVGGKFENLTDNDLVDAWEVNVFPNVKEKNADQVQENKAIKCPVEEHKDSYYKKKSELQDGGTTNRFAVTYTKNGETVTEYYNYVFKNPKYDLKDLSSEQIKKEMEEGPIYLAQIKPVLNEQGEQLKNNNGKLLWYTEPVEGANDNYKELVNTINQYKNQYVEAEKARKAAEDKVAELQRQISEIQRVYTIDLDELKEGYNAEALFSDCTSDDPQIQLYYKLVKDLSEAEKELGTAQENVNEAKRILDSIDLSRFGGSSVTDDDTDGGSDAGATVFDAGGVTITIPGGNTIPAGFTLDNVIAGGGANAAGGGVNAVIINDGGVPLDNGNGAAAQVAGAGSKVAKQNQAKKQNIKGIKDSAVPLANIPAEDGAKMSWYWLLIIFLLGAAGKKMYDEYKKKQEEEAAAKINK